MPNPNPEKARRAKAEKRRQALEPILETLQEAVESARGLLQEEDPAVRLRAVHAVSQSAVSYAKVYETGEIEARLEALEERLEEVSQ